jgi:peptidoglycan/LPS O-acetylase OafA/YrhL
LPTNYSEIKKPSVNSLEIASARFGKQKQANKRLEFLDLMRGIAALAVLVEHGGYHFLRGFAAFTHSLFSFGKFGLTCFFLVSGFVIPFSLEGRPGLKRFWVLRIFRLYPIYWFSLFSALILYRLGLKDVLTPEFLSHFTRNAIVNVSMLQGIVMLPHAIGLYYTLTIEMLFYGICTVLIWRNWLRQSYLICWLVLILASSISLGVPLLLHRRVEMAGLFYIVTLAVGATLYRVYLGEVSRKAFTTLTVCVGLFVCAGVWFNYLLNKKDDVFEHYTFAAVVLPWAAAYVLFIAMLALPHLKCPRMLLWVGRISYSLYLLHPLVLSFFRVREGNILGFFVFTGLSLLVASCTYLLIEKPAMRLGQQLLARQAPRTVSVLAN